MTVNTGLMLSGPFAADGSNKDWDFGFKITAESQVLILVGDDTNGLNLQYITSGYTVDPQYIDNNTGGVVVYPAVGSAVIAGKQVWISTRINYEQDTDFTAQGSFSPLLHEQALDFLSLQIKQLAREAQYSVKVQVGATPPVITETILENHVIVGGPDGTLINGPDVESIEQIGDLHDEIIAIAAIADSIPPVALAIPQITTVAANITDVTNFSDVYLGPWAVDPVLRNDGSALHAGDMYFSTTLGNIRVYSGASWASPFALSYGGIVQGQATATGGQTAFVPGAFTDIAVFKNGIKMAAGSYTAATPNITLAVGATVGDIISWLGYNATSAVTSYTKSEVDGLLIASDAAVLAQAVLLAETGMQDIAGPITSPAYTETAIDGVRPLRFSNFLAQSGGDEQAAFQAAINKLYTDSGEYRHDLDLEGFNINLSATVFIPNTGGSARRSIYNGKLTAVASASWAINSYMIDGMSALSSSSDLHIINVSMIGSSLANWIKYDTFDLFLTDFRGRNNALDNLYGIDCGIDGHLQICGGCYFLVNDGAILPAARVRNGIRCRGGDNKVMGATFAYFSVGMRFDGGTNILSHVHVFQGASGGGDTPEHTQGIKFTAGQVGSVINNLYLDKCFIEISNESAVGAVSLGGLTVNNVKTLLNSGEASFGFITCRDYQASTGLLILNVVVTNCAFRNDGSALAYPTKIQPSGNFDRTGIDGIYFANNTFANNIQPQANPIRLKKDFASSLQHTFDFTNMLPFSARIGDCIGIVTRERTTANQASMEAANINVAANTIRIDSSVAWGGTLIVTATTNKADANGIIL